jgi:UDP-glucose:(heptosyl)LPS alpha-1,3-glucosyltransferase
MRLALNYQRVDPSKGGAETYVVDLCRCLVDAGHEVDLYAQSWRADLIPEGVRCLPVEAKGRTRIGQIWNFAVNSEAALQQARDRYDCTVGFINTWSHDVLIPQGGTHAGSLLANSRRFGSPISRGVYRGLKRLNPKFWVYRSIEARQYEASRGARIVAVSLFVKRHIEQFHGVDPARIDVVPNAIDPGRLVVDDPAVVRREFRNRLGLRSDDLVGLFVGHNFELKGLGPLLKALSLRRRQQPEARPIRLVVSGGGKVETFQRIAHMLGIAEIVHFLGFYPDVRECYHACDFFAQPTFYDPCSLVVFEAMACGLPVISTACNGATELMSQGRHGFVLSEPMATGELLEALDAFSNDALRREMAEEAQILGRSHTFRSHADRLTSIFELVAESKAASSANPRRRDSGGSGPSRSTDKRSAGSLVP